MPSCLHIQLGMSDLMCGAHTVNILTMCTPPTHYQYLCIFILYIMIWPNLQTPASYKMDYSLSVLYT